MGSDETVYEETQYPPWWIYAVPVGVFVLVSGLITTAAAGRPGTAALTAVPLLLLVVFGSIILLLFRMRTTVYGDRIVVQFGWTSLVRFTIPLAEIRSCRAVSYGPLREFGGWGIRRDWSGRRAYAIRGDQAAEVVTTKRTILIGSAAPDGLSAAVNSLLPGGR
jgi:hypothetical protein